MTLGVAGGAVLGLEGVALRTTSSPWSVRGDGPVALLLRHKGGRWHSPRGPPLSTGGLTLTNGISVRASSSGLTPWRALAWNLETNISRSCHCSRSQNAATMDAKRALRSCSPWMAPRATPNLHEISCKSTFGPWVPRHEGEVGAKRCKGPTRGYVHNGSQCFAAMGSPCRPQPHSLSPHLCENVSEDECSPKPAAHPLGVFHVLWPAARSLEGIELAVGCWRQDSLTLLDVIGTEHGTQLSTNPRTRHVDTDSPAPLCRRFKATHLVVATSACHDGSHVQADA